MGIYTFGLMPKDSKAERRRARERPFWGSDPADRPSTRPRCGCQHQRENADGQEACGQAGHTAEREESGCAGDGGILGRPRHNRIGMEWTGRDSDWRGGIPPARYFRVFQGLTGGKRRNSREKNGAGLGVRDEKAGGGESCGYEDGHAFLAVVRVFQGLGDAGNARSEGSIEIQGH